MASIPFSSGHYLFSLFTTTIGLALIGYVIMICKPIQIHPNQIVLPTGKSYQKSEIERFYLQQKGPYLIFLKGKTEPEPMDVYVDNKMNAKLQEWLAEK